MNISWVMFDYVYFTGEVIWEFTNFKNGVLASSSRFSEDAVAVQHGFETL
jgi:hypothetical protein